MWQVLDVAVRFSTIRNIAPTLSNPTTDTSSGTLKPASLIAWSAPKAVLSLIAKTAVGGSGSDSLVGGDGFDVADYSASQSGVAVDLSTGISAGALESDTLVGIEAP